MDPSETSPAQPPAHSAVYGCYADLPDDAKPDDCVIGTGRASECIYAASHKTKQTCPHYRAVPEEKPRSKRQAELQTDQLAFENWFARHNPSFTDLPLWFRKDQNGAYSDRLTKSQWEAWSGALAWLRTEFSRESAALVKVLDGALNGLFDDAENR